MTRKFIITIGVFILLTFILAGGWFWYGSEIQELTQEDVTDEEQSFAKMKTIVSGNEYMADVDMSLSQWNTYRNDKYGFEFKYPDQFKLRTIEADGGEIFSLSMKDFTDTIKIQIYFNSLEGVKGAFVRDEFENFQKTVTVGDRKGVMFTYSAEDIGKVNKYTTPAYETTKEEQHVVQITQELIDKRGNIYQKYLNFQQTGSCENVHFEIELQSKVVNQARFNDGVLVSCSSDDVQIGKALSKVFSTLRFFEQ